MADICEGDCEVSDNSGKHRMNSSYRRLTTDLEFRVQEPSAADRYARIASGSVIVVPVVRDDSTVLGYLWFSDEEWAAGYVPRPDEAPASYDAGIAWRERLKLGWGRRIPPSEAVNEFSASVSDALLGRPDNAAVTSQPSLGALKEFASRAQ